MERFAKESEKTRLSRDVFIFDPQTMDFLVKPWGASTITNEGHRSNLQYGNAFGTFLYRPPKDDIDLQKQKDISTEMMIKDEGVVLKFNVSEGVVGWKTIALLLSKFPQMRRLPSPFVLPLPYMGIEVKNFGTHEDNWLAKLEIEARRLEIRRPIEYRRAK